ncbi:MAG: hypothetical protein H7A49_15195 [Akkermansiaceae bacterium]|nr:hypothetical protein [Akkermansiaceae bacterium]MCP5549075.1 hypothetical protein [Akkermansiaceae bacterium]
MNLPSTAGHSPVPKRACISRAASGAHREPSSSPAPARAGSQPPRPGGTFRDRFAAALREHFANSGGY